MIEHAVYVGHTADGYAVCYARQDEERGRLEALWGFRPNAIRGMEYRAEELSGGIANRTTLPSWIPERFMDGDELYPGEIVDFVEVSYVWRTKS